MLQQLYRMSAEYWSRDQAGTPALPCRGGRSICQAITESYTGPWRRWRDTSWSSPVGHRRQVDAPSPSGRGRGCGKFMRCTRSKRPHPDPLPLGERTLCLPEPGRRPSNLVFLHPHGEGPPDKSSSGASALAGYGQVCTMCIYHGWTRRYDTARLVCRGSLCSATKFRVS